jgi:hypothetical protein
LIFLQMYVENYMWCCKAKPFQWTFHIPPRDMTTIMELCRVWETNNDNSAHRKHSFDSTTTLCSSLSPTQNSLSVLEQFNKPSFTESCFAISPSDAHAASIARLYAEHRMDPDDPNTIPFPKRSSSQHSNLSSRSRRSETVRMPVMRRAQTRQ